MNYRINMQKEDLLMSTIKFNSNKRKHSIECIEKPFHKNIDDYHNASITHSRFYKCSFIEINFNRAAVTGSVFEKCTFDNCNFNDADFEFCEFRECEINIEIISGCSFNNSNFILSTLNKIKFIGCTFTGSFWEESKINDINIEYSTLEGTCFSNCIFEDIDWRELNLEYVEFNNPSMNNATLPFHQIPYTFGLLQYLVNTSDLIKITDGYNTLDIDSFFQEGIPFLINEYTAHKLYFPLSNIYLFGESSNYNKAFDYLSKEVANLSTARDYRRIKFCCKLLSDSHIFTQNQLNKVYKIITETDISIKPNSAEMKSYSRNIGEIRSILFERKRTPKLEILLKANITIENSMRFSNLINQLQKIAKPGHTDALLTTITLSQNSPLLINIVVEGDERFFPIIISSFFTLTGNSIQKSNYLSLLDTVYKEFSSEICETNKRNETIYEQFKNDGIVLTMTEYHLSDCIAVLNTECKSSYINKFQLIDSGDN